MAQVPWFRLKDTTIVDSRRPDSIYVETTIRIQRKKGGAFLPERTRISIPKKALNRNIVAVVELRMWCLKAKQEGLADKHRAHAVKLSGRKVWRESYR